MPTKRRIVVATRDSSVRWNVNERPPSDHFGIVEFDENTSVVSTAPVDLVSFRVPRDLDRKQALGATFRSHIGQNAPLLCCAGRYVYVLFRQLLNAVRKMIIVPFDARELREKLNEPDLGFYSILDNRVAAPRKSFPGVLTIPSLQKNRACSRWRTPRSRMASV